MFNTFHDIPLHNILTSFSIHFIFATMKLSLSFVFAFQEILFLEHTTRNEWEIIFFLFLLHEKKKKYSVILYSKDTQRKGAWCFHQIFTYSSRQSFCKLFLLLLYSTSVVVLSMIFAIFTLFLLFYVRSFRCYRK